MDARELCNEAAAANEAIDIWEKWNAERFDLLKSVGHDKFDGFLNCYRTYSVDYKKDKQGNQKENRTDYIEVYGKINSFAELGGMMKFLQDPRKAYMRFDSNGSGLIKYYTVGYKVA